MFKFSKVLNSFTLLFMFIFLLNNTVYANTKENNICFIMQIGNTKYEVDGNIIEFDTAPLIYNESTYIPLTVLSQLLNSEISWNKKSNLISFQINSSEYELEINNITGTINNSKYTLDTAPLIIDNQPMVPLKFICKTMLFDLSWAAETKTIIITYSTNSKSDYICPYKYSSYEENEDKYFISPQGENVWQIVYFSQTDSRWNKVPFTVINNPSQTIGATGCAPTAASMVFSKLLNENIYPPQLAKFIIENGHRTKNSGTSYSFYNDATTDYTLNCTQTSSLDDVIKALSTPNTYVIASMGKGTFTSDGHLISLFGVFQENNKSKFIIADPYCNNRNYKNNSNIEKSPYDGIVYSDVNIVNNQKKSYFIISK